MTYNVRSMRDRAKQLLALQKRGIVDREKQARNMQLSIGHVSRIRGWMREHGIGDERSVHRPPLTPAPPASPLAEMHQRLANITPLPESFYSHLTVKLYKHVVEQLHAFCQKNDVTVESAVTIALEHYLKTRPR
jgi:hypothetical protein